MFLVVVVAVVGKLRRTFFVGLDWELFLCPESNKCPTCTIAFWQTSSLVPRIKFCLVVLSPKVVFISHLLADYKFGGLVIKSFLSYNQSHQSCHSAFREFTPQRERPKGKIEIYRNLVHLWGFRVNLLHLAPEQTG